MHDWLTDLKIKRYPHFDKFLSKKEIEEIVTSPERVAKNAFFPFITYYDKRRRFGRSVKIRPIRYASRRDSCVYSYYRHLLLPKYEQKLLELNIKDVPIAYRSIPVSIQSPAKKGKCNIHFAKEVFKEIQRRKSCFVLSFDVKNFFESLDHEKLHMLWCNLLQKNICHQIIMQYLRR